MKTRLDQLTTAQFIDLVCGDSSVLFGNHELAGQHKVAVAVRDIVMEYRSIADPAGNAAYLRRIDTLIKSQLAVALYSMCKVLVSCQRVSEAREILISSGLSADLWNDKRIESEIHIRLQKSKRELDELEEPDEEGESQNIRDSFNSLTAALMAHFKFQIDTSTMMASVFAHLVSRFHSDVKEMRKALKRK